MQRDDSKSHSMKRRKTRQISVGGVKIGGSAPISVQSMTKTDTRNVEGTISQIRQLEAAGCSLVRLAVVDQAACDALVKIKETAQIPLIADIHFDYRLALKALEAGVDGLRINPGNIGGREKSRLVVREAMKRSVPIRIGVNAGSLDKDLLKKHGHPTAEAMVESCLRHVHMLESWGFCDIKVSVKASNVMRTIEAYRILSERIDCPLHIGVTEAGPPPAGTIRSAVGIGTLLAEGIGDTIRVSLTAPVEEEVKVGREILKALFLKESGPVIISCPTCGRCEIDLMRLVKQVERRLVNVKQPTVVAIMGCVVNGPGEAREADVGIAAGKGTALIFRKGEIIKKVAPSKAVSALLKEMKQVVKRRGKPRRR